MRSRGYAAVARRARAVNAMVPPSPWLSARKMNITYLNDTTHNSDHRISDRIPSTPSWLTGTP
ncbi:hypothetical protein D3C80_1573340 [compost metagenome]